MLGSGQPVPVTDWFGRQQFVHDSYAMDNTGDRDNCLREIELEEIRVAMAKPLINGDKVLMIIMGDLGRVWA